MKSLVLIFTCLLLCCNVNAVELNTNSSKFRKMSMHLLGSSPSKSTYEKVSQMNTEEFKEYYQSQVSNYLNDSQFEKRMFEKFSDLMGFSISNTDTDNMMNNIFKKIISLNLSWDQVILYNNHSIDLSEDDMENYDDKNFYELLWKEQIKDYLEEKENNSESNEPKNSIIKSLTESQKNALAGVVTTDRFYSRFVTTKTNKNRRRAATIFRVFLCDDMRPVILENKKENEELLALALGDKKGASNQAVPDFIKHGTQKQCQSCHQKLDPTANTFRNSSNMLYSRPSSGALVFTGDDGRSVNIPVKGIGELAKAITQQPEYAKCQVKHFWNWFVGEDILLDDEMTKVLVDKFNEVDRKPKDFVNYLVNRREFLSPNAIDFDDIRYSNVKPIFKRCDTCHTSERSAPILSKNYPYGSAMQNEMVLGWVKYALKLSDKATHKQSMPPKNAGWTLAEEEKDLIKAWLNGGAKNDKGERQIRNDYQAKYYQDINYKSEMFLNNERKPLPTFLNTFSRYMRNNDLPNQLESVFGKHDESDFDETCNPDYIYEDSQSVTDALGFNNLITRLPKSKIASPAYYDFLRKCASMLITDKFVGDFSEEFTLDLNSQWTDLDSIQKYKLITDLIHSIIGFNVLSKKDEFSESHSLYKLVSNNFSESTLEEVIKAMAFSLAISDNFTTY